ncbi:MAG: peroxide stress protein YaaA [Microbacteriaceae bacterium]|nr:peroxide stress protein YaaA [Microbacteriaceae bacterium]
MLFLLPPSETKDVGGKPLNIGQVALTFGQLNEARDLVYAALRELCEGDGDLAAKVLGLGKKQLGDLQVNLEVQTAPIMPALDRYTGTLYDGLHGRGLKGTPTEFASMGQAARERAKDTLLIQSALFGLIPALNLIPNYRLSGTTRLPGLSLRDVWAEAHERVWPRLEDLPLIDLRSKSYAELAPIPEDVPHFWVDVVSEDSSGQQRALNHFNKKAKGEFVRSVLELANPAATVSDLKKAAKKAGLRLEESKAQLTLIV